MTLKTLKPSIKVLDTRTAKAQPSTRRIAGNSLYALMARFERDNPRICAECQREGLVRAGEELDHKIPLWAGGSNDTTNLQWLCVEHHKTKTIEEAGLRSKGDPGAIW